MNKYAHCWEKIKKHNNDASAFRAVLTSTAIEESVLRLTGSQWKDLEPDYDFAVKID